MKKINNLFKGRINRKNYIFGLFFSAVVILVLFIVGLPLYKTSLDHGYVGMTFFICILGMIVYFLDIVFLISLHIRRFHDIGWTAWNVLFFLIPLVNAVFIIMLLITKGMEGENKYGAKLPKSIKFFPAIFNQRK